jgi:hypothetical protein
MILCIRTTHTYYTYTAHVRYYIHFYDNPGQVVAQCGMIEVQCRCKTYMQTYIHKHIHENIYMNHNIIDRGTLIPPLPLAVHIQTISASIYLVFT